jgi:tRNA (cytidine/uridine-2'-O-)-methyltransferase
MSDKKQFTIVLFQPQIPQNTGNIVRTCKVAGSKLVLVKPLGFSTSSAALKRAGLDYWDGVDVEIISDLFSWLSKTSSPFYFFSSHAKSVYTTVEYPEDAILIFGSETAGLAPIFHQTWPERFLTLPMMKDSRCLNLSNAASIVLYEAWRQQGFRGAVYEVF